MASSVAGTIRYCRRVFAHVFVRDTRVHRKAVILDSLHETGGPLKADQVTYASRGLCLQRALRGSQMSIAKSTCQLRLAVCIPARMSSRDNGSRSSGRRPNEAGARSAAHPAVIALRSPHCVSVVTVHVMLQRVARNRPSERESSVHIESVVNAPIDA